MFKILWTIFALLSLIIGYGQNVKPIPMADTIKLYLNDSICTNILSNDTDPNGDKIKLSKFDKWTVPIQFKTIITDTAVISFNQAGIVCYKAKKVGVFTYNYIPQDGKSGSGKTGKAVFIVTGKTKWISSYVHTPCIVNKDSGRIRLIVDGYDYYGQVHGIADVYTLDGSYYYTWDNSNKRVKINVPFTITISKEIYLWVQQN